MKLNKQQQFWLSAEEIKYQLGNIRRSLEDKDPAPVKRNPEESKKLKFSQSIGALLEFSPISLYSVLMMYPNLGYAEIIATVFCKEESEEILEYCLDYMESDIFIFEIKKHYINKRGKK